MQSFNIQLEELQAHPRFSFAHILKRLENEVIISIPHVQIPKGWSHEFITFVFKVYDHMCQVPSSFWTQEEVRFKNGYLPQSTHHGYINGPPFPDKCKMLWLYKPAMWSPVNDTLTTYAHFIRTRFNYEK
jgi:hypothetical protein